MVWAYRYVAASDPSPVADAGPGLVAAIRGVRDWLQSQRWLYFAPRLGKLCLRQFVAVLDHPSCFHLHRLFGISFVKLPRMN